MKQISLICLLAVSLLSCKDQSKKDPVPETGEKEIHISDPVTAGINLLGSYVGSFGDNKVTLLITSVAGDTIAGRTIVGGNDRPFTGTLAVKGTAYNISAKEPGDNEYDGSFNFTIMADKPNDISGTWVPNKPTATIKEKKYTLSRREFSYRTDVGSYPEASQRLLKEADVENMTKPELELMRNEIFARHGYCFQRKASREQFERFDWYIPNSVDIKKDLTDTEKKNIALIKKYEKYAAEYGDDFGR